MVPFDDIREMKAMTAAEIFDHLYKEYADNEEAVAYLDSNKEEVLSYPGERAWRLAADMASGLSMFA